MFYNIQQCLIDLLKKGKYHEISQFGGENNIFGMILN